MNLYNLTGVYKQLTDIVEGNEGELSPELESALNSNEDAIEQKLESYGHVIQNLNAEASVLEAKRRAFLEEADRIKGLQRARERRCEQIKGHIAECLKVANIRNAKGHLGAKTETFNFWVQEDTSVEFDEANLDSVPQEYRRVTVKESLDKIGLIADWQAAGASDDARDLGFARIITKLGLRMR